MRGKRMNFVKWKHTLYMLVAGGMLVFALPKLSFTGWSAGFSIAWLFFTLLVIGANLHFILGVDEEKKQALDRVRKAKLRQWELRWTDNAEQGNKVKIVPAQAKEHSQ
ncbi:hypothetical protein [Paenibacillus sp. 453mf]|uniref:hypothetical protein n=1 Tax=Paenibacillus sp. 453mf TaxID=1761874 RepID=UPI0008E70F84|nr:hypothetical protein [Paenibacillus sp. 453mf]SFS44412.1 hypothetical protein SAMN04488601_101685 [Paenibacillus sp. 453mf]